MAAIVRGTPHVIEIELLGGYATCRLNLKVGEPRSTRDITRPLEAVFYYCTSSSFELADMLARRTIISVCRSYGS